MISENKKRLTVTFSDSVVNDLDILCDQMGVTKSQFVAIAVGEKIYQYKMASDALAKIGVDLMQKK